MLVVETIARIRRDHLVKGVPIKKIARDLRVSKNTVRKVVRGDETSFSYRRGAGWAWIGLGAVTVAASVVAGLLGPIAIAAFAVVLSVPTWAAWWWLAHRG